MARRLAKILLVVLICLQASAILAQEEVRIVKKIEKIEYDYVLATTTEYFGWAQPGTLTSVARWKIMRITYTGTDFVIEWCDSNQLYDNEWDDRAAVGTVYG